MKHAYFLWVLSFAGLFLISASGNVDHIDCLWSGDLNAYLKVNCFLFQDTPKSPTWSMEIKTDNIERNISVNVHERYNNTESLAKSPHCTFSIPFSELGAGYHKILVQVNYYNNYTQNEATLTDLKVLNITDTPSSIHCEERGLDDKGFVRLDCETGCTHPQPNCSFSIFNEKTNTIEELLEKNLVRYYNDIGTFDCSSTCVIQLPLNELSEGNFNALLSAYSKDPQENVTFDLPLYIGPPILTNTNITHKNITLAENYTLDVVITIQCFPLPNISLYIEINNSSTLLPKEAYFQHYRRNELTNGDVFIEISKVNGNYFTNYSLVLTNKYGSLSYPFIIFKEREKTPYKFLFDTGDDHVRFILSICGAVCTLLSIICAVVGYVLRKRALQRKGQQSGEVKGETQTKI